MEASSMEEISDREQFDDQNTNRNEACAASACNELMPSAANGLSEKQVLEVELQKDSLPQVECKFFVIPTIVITSADEEETKQVPEAAEDAVVTLAMDELSLEESNSIEHEDPLSLTEEDNKPREVKSGCDTASDDDFEVICRCASTPMSVNHDSLSSLSSAKCGGGNVFSSFDEPRSPSVKEKDGESDMTRDSESLSHGSPSTTYSHQLPQAYGSMSPGEDSTQDLSGSEFSSVHLLNCSSGYDAAAMAALSHQIPVYNVNGTTVTYVSGPQSAAAFSPILQREGCQVQIPNGLAATYLATAGKAAEKPVAEGGRGEVGSSQAGPGGENGEGGVFQSTGSGSVDMYNFVYPSIYVSSAGLISVLLRHDMSVEMTVDRTIRVVSHQHLMAVATDSRGTSACLYHPALKVIQQGTTTDIATDNVRVHMGHDDVAFAVGHSRYRFDSYDIQPATHVKFADIYKDQSVNLLFSSEGYGENLVPQCLEVASKAEYANLPKGGVIVRINGVKVTQTGGGDVTVVTGAKFIRLSPSFGMTRLGNRFIDIEIERDWSSRVSRGPHCFFAGDRHVIISNGKLEVDVNEHGRFKVAHLQPRRPVTPQQCLRQSDNYVRRVNSVTYTASPAARAARGQAPRRRSAPVGVSL